MQKTNTATQTCVQPVTIFWDLENVQIPRNTSIEALVEKLRNTFCAHFMEDNIFVVCDVFKEKKKNIEELVLCNCTIIHVPSLAKNAADHKLETLIRKFAERNFAACVVLISSDINFLTVLTEARYRYKNKIIILHKDNVNKTYLNIANECVNFDAFVAGLPNIMEKISTAQVYEVEVKNLPSKKQSVLKKDLERMADNTGGKVKEIAKDRAILKYGTAEAAKRCVKRLNSEKLQGKKLVVNEKPSSEASTSTGSERQSDKDVMSQELLKQIVDLFSGLKDIPLSSLQRFYSLKYGQLINVRILGYNHVFEFIQKYPHIFKISGNKGDKSICLRKNHSETTDSEESDESYFPEPGTRKKRKL